MDQMLAEIDVAFDIIDNILKTDRDIEHYDAILNQVVERETGYNLKSHFKNYHIIQQRVSYMGHIITEQGIQYDPEKEETITEIPALTEKGSVKRLLGLIQYLAKCIFNL